MDDRKSIESHESSSPSLLFQSGGGSGDFDPSPETLLALGDSLSVDENHGDAVEAYAAALSLLRGSDGGGVLRLRILSHRSGAFYRLGRYREALGDAESSLALLPSLLSSTTTAAVVCDGGGGGLRAGEGELCHRRAGLAALELHRPEKAARFLRDAARLASLNDRKNHDDDDDGDGKLRNSYYERLLARCASESTTVAAAAAQVNPPGFEATSPPPTPQAPTMGSVPAQRIRPVVLAAGNRKQQDPTPKYQYYQSNKVMTVSILEVGVRPEDLTVRFEPKRLLVLLRRNGTNVTVVAGTLWSEIDVERSKVVFLEEKVLVKLRKAEHHEWHELLDRGDAVKPAAKLRGPETPSGDEAGAAAVPPPEAVIPTRDPNKPRPYASHRDWDAMEQDIAEAARDEPAGGEAAMKELFQKIYAGATDDTRRAMVKSFQTSGGTVLTTNWDEAKTKDYETEGTGEYVMTNQTERERTDGSVGVVFATTAHQNYSFVWFFVNR